MSELPSKVKDRKYIRMPEQNKVVDSDEEWSRYGKWILVNRTGDISWIDETWLKLQVLLEKGCVIMIKASTAAATDWPSEPGTILCFSRPGREEIERVAKEIRKVVHYEECMYYKLNNITENKVDHRYGHKRISHYMHTPKGYFYEHSEKMEDWILVNGTEHENQPNTLSMNLMDVKKSADSYHLLSNSRQGFRILKSRSKNLKKLPTPTCFRMWANLEEVGNHLSEADRLWIVGKKLFNEGAIDAITCKKLTNTAEFRFFFLDKLDTESLVKLCDKIRHEAQVFRFIYICMENVRCYRYSPEKELCKFVPNSHLL